MSRLRGLFLFLTLLSSLTSPLITQAHDTGFFEFAPDAWQSERVLISSLQTPIQIFQPAISTTLTGFSFWVDNTGSAGDVSFALIDSDYNTLATKTITLPAISAVDGGTKFHVDLTTPVALTAGATYGIQINSTLPGFGIYYANRITILEHNLPYTLTYQYGAARVGGDDQPYTFKFALYHPVTGSAIITTPTPTPTPTSTTPTSAVMNNVHAVLITGTSATFAWSTNIATDSRISIRTQLSSLYTIATTFDPTLELEHTLTIYGLNPSIAYFADISSGLGEQYTLATYTLGFTTTASGQQSTTVYQNPGTTTNTTTTTSNTNTNSNTTTSNTTTPTSSTSNTTNSNTNSNTTGSQTTNSNSGQSTSNNSGSNTTSGLAVEPGTKADNFTLAWDEPTTGAPVNGYRVDIFDANNGLERQFRVGSSTTEQVIGGLPAGDHRAIVYANNEGTFTKVAPSKEFNIKSQVNKHIWISVTLAVLFFLLSSAGVIWWFAKEKSPLPVIEE